MTILLIAICYLTGSIPTAVWISKIFYGTDIRTYGSGNSGSTNMFRTFGFKAGIATQVIDILKGVTVALLGIHFTDLFPAEGIMFGSLYFPLDGMICGLAAVIGHIFPVLAGFRGGKGINTLLGIMMVVYPIGAAIALGTFMLSLLLTKMVSVGSILGSLSFPVFVIAMKFPSEIMIDWNVAGLGFAFFLIVVFTHRTNISRILKGNENKVNVFGKKN